jgi:hypothetical protein
MVNHKHWVHQNGNIVENDMHAMIRDVEINRDDVEDSDDLFTEEEWKLLL